MKRLLFLVSMSTLLSCLTIGCQQGEKAAGKPVVNVEADVQAIKGIIAEWNAAFNTGDIEKSMSYRAEDQISIHPNEPALVGKEAHRRLFQQWFDEYVFDEKDVVQNVHVSGDLAVAHITWSAINTPKAGGKPTKGNGNMIGVFKKQPDGDWRGIYLIYSDESLVYPAM